MRHPTVELLGAIRGAELGDWGSRWASAQGSSAKTMEIWDPSALPRGAKPVCQGGLCRTVHGSAHTLIRSTPGHTCPPHTH